MAATPSSPAALSSSVENCPICWDELSTFCGRTLVTLQCSHKFHLDCIGSTFNSFGEMRCPLCRATENGTWVIPGERAAQAASDTEDDDSDSDADEFEFDEWDLFPVQEGLMEPTRALFYQALSLPAVLAIEDGTVYHQVSAFDIIRQLNCEWNQPPLQAFNSMLNHFATANNMTRVVSSTPRSHQVSAFDIIRQLNCEWNQPPLQAFNSMFNHFATANNMTRVVSSTPRSSPGLSGRNVDIDSFIEPVILEHGRSNGPMHCNFDWICLPNNSPSPGVRAMMSGQSGYNGLPRRVPSGNAELQSEQAQFNVPLNAPFNRQHQELTLIVPSETHNVSPSDSSPDNIDPSLKE